MAASPHFSSLGRRLKELRTQSGEKDMIETIRKALGFVEEPSAPADGWKN